MNCKHPVVYALLFAVLLSLSSASFAQIAVGVAFNVRIAPPALPVYEQPLCPGPGYLWTPGYWAWSDDDGYYWVPGTWVMAPEVGLLWTPGYWGWSDGFYGWHAGYWGPEVGFYGGVNYGFGYGGVGFGGGEWRGGAFFYNTAVMRVDTVHITNVYVNRTVIVNNESRVSFNGGESGINARPSAREESYARERHTAPVAAQMQQEHSARQNRQNFAAENHGRPAVAATARPGEFSGHGVVAARAAGGAYHAPTMSPREARGPSGPAVSRNNGEPRSNVARPFTPPMKNNARENNAPQNNPRENNMRQNSMRENSMRENNARVNNNRENAMRSENVHPQSEARPSQPKNQPRPEARTEARPQPRPEARMEPRPQPRPEARPNPAPRREAPPKREPPPKDEKRK
jgi:hypothetical protein